MNHVQQLLRGVVVASALSMPASLVADGGGGAGIVADGGVLLHLRTRSIDPLVASPVSEGALRALPSSRLAIVQFATVPSPAMVSSLREAGVIVHKYLPDQAFVVTLPSPSDAVAALPGVRWVGPVEPVDKVDPSLLSVEAGVLQKVIVQTVARGGSAKAPVRSAMERAGGAVLLAPDEGFLIRGTLDSAGVLELARRDDVLRVEPWRAPVANLTIARDVTGATGLEFDLGLTGEGVRGEVMDGNLRTSHEEFQDPPALIHGTVSGSRTHGTSVFGIVFANGKGAGPVRGMLPDAEQPIFADFERLTNRYTHTRRLVDAEGPYRAVFQTNSWGTPGSLAYDAISMELDDIAFENDLVIIHSHGNVGLPPNNAANSEAWAKNIVSVGAVFHGGTADDSNDCWCGIGRTGPAPDGRVKPDVAHFGDNIETVGAASDTSLAVGFAGTSASAPIVAGVSGLISQMWHEGVFPGFGGGATVFESRPAAATARALLIHGAFQYEFEGPDQDTLDLGRFRQGWGRPGLDRLLDEASRMLIVDESVPLAMGGRSLHYMRVDDASAGLRVTLCVKDLPGNTLSSVSRVNDLSLRVVSPSGVAYVGNAGLMDGVESVAGGVFDTINPVEQVLLSSPEPGVWLIEVVGSEVVEDAELSTPGVDASFGLVASGGTAMACVSDWSADGVVDGSDLISYLEQFFLGTGDVDGDGVTDILDLLVFVTGFFRACS